MNCSLHVIYQEKKLRRMSSKTSSSVTGQRKRRVENAALGANLPLPLSNLWHGDDRAGGSQGGQLLDGSHIGRKFDLGDVDNDSRTQESRSAGSPQNHQDNRTQRSPLQRETNRP